MSDESPACTNACTCDAENVHERPAETQGNGQTDANRLPVIADLLADLPESERREVIAELSPVDRATIARLLIGLNAQRDRT